MLDMLLTHPVFVLIVGLALRALLLAGVLLVIGIPVLAAIYGWQGLLWAFGRATGLHRDGQLRWSDDCYYAPTHLWLRHLKAGILRVGLDDIAQRVLPDVRTLRLATAGSRVQAGEPMGEVWCGDARVMLMAPITGVVQAVNDRVVRRPELLHRDPYRAAWLADVRPVDEGYRQWPAADRARAWLAKEDQRVTRLFEHEWGIAAADGGELVAEEHRALTPEQWQHIRESVLGGAA
jgi:glycine cleavage system H protein